VSGDVVSLRRARKAKQRAAAADTAAENRVRFGQSKAQRRLETAEAGREQRMFEGHRRAPGDHAAAAAPGAPAVRDPLDGR
jgi:hypothetical protein